MANFWPQKKILVVDDFAAFRRSVKRMLESFGAKDVDDVGSGEEAVRRAERKAYDIILCDYNLGEGRKDGQQVIEELKHRQLLRPSCVLVMITADSTANMVMGAIEYRPDAYLLKPFVPEILRRRLEKFVEGKSEFLGIENSIKKRDFLEAIRTCDQKIAENGPGRYELLRMKGELCTMVGDYDLARQVYQEVLDIRPIPWARLGLAKTLYLSGAYGEARDSLEEIIEDNHTFTEAYDWLAKTLEKLGSLKESLEILRQATDISPKAILRQKALAEVSYRTRDYTTAEQAFRNSVALGKHSCHKSATDHVGLAKVYVDQGTPDKALQVTREARDEFRNVPEARMQVAAMDGFIYTALERPEEARRSMKEAAELFDKAGVQKIPLKASLEVARAFLAMGEQERGLKLAQEIIQNNHEDEGVLLGVQKVFDETHMGARGRQLIASASEEVVLLNNQGVQLVEEGKLAESIEYFEQAVTKLPGNKIINANTAHALMLHMRKFGVDKDLLARAKKCLDQTRELDPSYQKYRELLPLYERLSSAGPSSSVDRDQE